MKKIMIKNPVLVRFGMILVLALAISSIVSSFFLGSRMRQENVEMMEKTISVVEYTLDTDKPLQEQLQKVHASALDANVRVTIIAKDGTVLAAVSYTHLDVYKRQHMPCGRKSGTVKNSVIEYGQISNSQRCRKEG